MMKIFFKSLAIIFLLSLTGAAQREIVRVKLVDVHDGDTMTVSDESKHHFKIRLIGIDAPELAQKFGDKSRKALKKLLKTDKDNIIVRVFGKDRSDRILAQIFVGETDVNLELLRRGLAWFYDSRDLKKEDLKIYKTAFESAREAKHGLFAKEDSEEPKEFRKKKRSKR